jgi:hypothetical protein
MSCARVSLLTNKTRPPGAIVTCDGEIPVDVIVNVGSF